MQELPENIEAVKEFLDVSEIADEAGVSRLTVYKVLEGVSKNQDVIKVIWAKVAEMAKVAEDANNSNINIPLHEGGK